jgi:hypothetical protein
MQAFLLPAHASIEYLLINAAFLLAHLIANPLYQLAIVMAVYDLALAYSQQQAGLLTLLLSLLSCRFLRESQKMPHVAFVPAVLR